MKCPNCGAENPDAETYCQKCASPLETVRKTPGELKTRSRRKLVVAAAIIIALVIIIPSVVYVYKDPRYSWNSSIRDHDDDGVSDRSDPRPYDPSIWTYGSAYINLTIHNNFTDPVQFDVYVMLVENHENQYDSQREVPANDMLVKSFNVRWLMGNISTEWWVWLSGTVTGAQFGKILDVGTFVMHDGQSLTLSVTFPDDFLPWPY